jgi:hypothetical protein
MRHGLKVLGLSLLASLSVMAFTAVGAQASGLINSGEFLIEDGIGSGGLKTGLLTFKQVGITSETISGEQTVLWGELLILELELVLKCKTAAVSEATISALGHGKAKIVFSACELRDHLGNPSGCIVHPIKALVLALVILHGANLHPYLLFEPQSGEVFATVTLLDEPLGVCLLPTPVDVTGKVVAEILKPLEHQVKPLIAVNSGTLTLFPSHILKYGENEAHLTTEALVHLTGANDGKKWSAH